MRNLFKLIHTIELIAGFSTMAAIAIIYFSDYYSQDNNFETAGNIFILIGDTTP